MLRSGDDHVANVGDEVARHVLVDAGIFSFEIRHVRYMPIDVGTAHNHTAAVGKPSIPIALISDIPNPAPPPAILMSDVRNVSSRCAYCCHLRHNCTGISCRIPYTSHAPNI